MGFYLCKTVRNYYYYLLLFYSQGSQCLELLSNFKNSCAEACEVLIREADELLLFKCSDTIIYASVGAKNKHASE